MVTVINLMDGYKYRWSTWTNGMAYEAVKGVDFHCSAHSFMSVLHKYAARHGLTVETKKKSETVVQFQFFTAAPKSAKARKKR